MVVRLRTRPRQGLILLVVLGMLALFSLLSVTYVVYSGTSRTASLQMARRDYRGTPAVRLMDQAIRQIIRGTGDTDSAVWRHSLLEDLYGSLDAPIQTRARDLSFDTGRTYAMAYTAPAFPLSVGHPVGPALYGRRFLKIPLNYAADIPLQNDALTGRVLTFTTGPLIGQSFRIIRSVGQLEIAELNTLDACQFTVLIDLSTVQDRAVTVGSVTKSVSQWINENADGTALLYEDYVTSGRLDKPFSMMINDGAQNGPGIGVSINNSASISVASAGTPAYEIFGERSLVAPFTGVPDGILPNHSFTNLMTRPSYGQPYTQTGDTDEPYDAADYNNFFLALRRGGATTSDDVIPSFHRPEVINFLASLDSNSLLLSSMSDDQMRSFLNLVHRATGRPISYSIKNFPSLGNTFENHNHFTGGSGIDITSGTRNPQLILDWNNKSAPAEQAAFDSWLRWMVRGPWDVDNDFDGIKDSVWVDLNFPLSTAPDGKLLKVLAAFYIEDMGGKLDLNAAGSQVQALASFPLRLSDTKYGFMAGGGTTPVDWPQGLGFGPADIYMRHLFDSDVAMQNVFQHRYASAVGSNKPGVDDTDDPISALLAHQSIDGASPPTSTRPSFPTYASLPGLPVSTHGRLGVALDLLGNPILMDSLTAPLNEELDDPYEAHVLSEGHSDQHIGVAEWERLLRYNDPDRSSLPDALETLGAGSFGLSHLDRLRSITPRSVSLSTPRFTRVLTTAAGPKRVASFVEFVESFAQRRYGVTYPRINNLQLAQLFPLEFAHNRPLDLNRPLGNGRDDPRPPLYPLGDGQVDEPAELVLNASQFEPWVSGATTPGDYFGNYAENTFSFDPGFDPTDAGFLPHSGMRSRQLFARHLYCLAQLILPVDASGDNLYIFPNQPDPTAPVGNETRARILAQWAVNVVDYRDADVAMTRFPYDPDPFRDIANNYSPAWVPDNAHVVFGFEQPELLITESLATHDTRARKRPSANDWDQLRLPQGSLFLEFFCPRSTAVTTADDNRLPGLPPTMYQRPSAGAPLALNLGSTVSNGTDVFPVWRVLLTKPEKNSSNVATADPFFTAFDGSDLETAPDSQPTAPNEVRTGIDSFRYMYQVGNSDAGLLWRMPDDPSINPPETTPVPVPTIDRVMWFADVLPTPNNVALPGVNNAPSKVYFYREGSNQVQGGQYLVVGPRPITYFGSKTQNAPLTHTPNNHRISLRRPDPANSSVFYWDWVQIYSQNNDPGFWITAAPPKSSSPLPAPIDFGSMVRECVTMVAGAEMPEDWGATLPPEITQNYVGINISEPTPTLDTTAATPVSEYYPIPKYRVNDADNTGDPAIDAEGYQTLSMDGYLDASVSPPTDQMPVFDADPAGNAGTHAFFLQKNGWEHNGVMPRPGTKKNWSAAVLQRLADPDRPWHPALNPYVTVDWHSIDLTVFSGEDHAVGAAYETFFATRAKSGRPSKIVKDGTSFKREFGNPGTTFFAYESSFPQDASTETGSGVYFRYELRPEHWTGQGSVTESRGHNSSFATLGYLNRNFVIRNTTTPEYFNNDYLGAPSASQSAPPSAPYHPNRNFINSHELANVTLCAPGTFNQDFYFQPTPGLAPPPAPLPRQRHTLDFETRLGTNVPGTIAELFEVTGVNSPWPDSWRVINPADTTRQAPSNNPLRAQNYLLGAYEAPLNFIPTYREPGRVNVNSASEDLVWRGLMGNIMPPSTRNSGGTVPYQSAVYGTMGVIPSASVLDRPHALPGQGGNPNFNSSMPTLLPGVFTTTTGSNVFPITPRFTNPADMTLYRRDPTSGQRIFDPSGLASISATGPINNSFVYNYPPTRTANLLTNQSHVFAVRMTLGYFEYTPGQGIGIEYGSEEGRATRNRAFYLIDRSIPVGFQPGVDHNTDDVIVARRIVE